MPRLTAIAVHPQADSPTDRTPSETPRLFALEGYAVLDTPPEIIFDELARMATMICETPIALVSLVDGTRQWFKARVGVDVSETPRETSFCSHAIQPSIVPDVREDARFSQSPLVVGSLGARFYAGAPLLTSEGVALGALYVIDRKPRDVAPKRWKRCGC